MAYNKKGIDTDVVATLIIALIVLVVILGYIFVFTDLAKGSANKQAVQIWVRTSSLEQQVTGSLSKTSRPPVPYLDDPLIIEKENLQSSDGNPPEVLKEIADSMYDCWGAFERGKSDFIKPSLLKGEFKETFCYPCRVIKFSDDIKINGPKINGLNNFLNSEKPIEGENNPTYLQYLSNNKEYTLDSEDIEEDVIDTNQDLYLMFYAASGRAWQDIALKLAAKAAGIEVESEQNIPSITQSSSEADIEGVSSAAKGSAVGAATLGRKTVAKTAGSTIIKISESLGGSAVIEGVKTVAGEGTYLVTTKIAKNSASKIVGKSIAKGLASVAGVKLIPYIGAAYTVYELVDGGIEIAFGDKPFAATVMIADPEKILPLCNQEQSKEEKKVEDQKAETVSRALDMYPSTGGGL